MFTVMYEALTDTLYVVVALVPFLSSYRALVYRSNYSDCNLNEMAGFGSFESGCFDVEARQFLILASQTLR